MVRASTVVPTATTKLFVMYCASGTKDQTRV